MNQSEMSNAIRQHTQLKQYCRYIVNRNASTTIVSRGKKEQTLCLSQHLTILETSSSDLHAGIFSLSFLLRKQWTIK